MIFEIEMAEKHLEEGEIRFSMFVDCFYPILKYNWTLYEIIYDKWVELTEKEHVDGSNTFKEATDKILKERVVKYTPEGLNEFKRAG